MSYYSNRLKNGNEIKAENYEIKNHDELDAVNKELILAQKRVEEVQQKLADKKEELISTKYHMPEQKRFVQYHRTGTLYDWDTCSPVADTGDAVDPIIIDAYNIRDEVAMISGWDMETGVIIIGEYQIRIETAKQKLHHRFIRQYVWDFINATTVGDAGYHGLNFLSTLKNSKDFVSEFFDCDYQGKYNLREMSDKYIKNKSFEIILKEIPTELVDRFLNLRILECQPINKILGITRPAYQKVKELGLLNILLAIIEEDMVKPENENDLINVLQIAKEAAEDFEFYGISGGYYYSKSIRKGAELIAIELLKYYYKNELIKKYYTLNKFVDYVIREVVNQGYTSLDTFCQELRDYISMCNDQNIKPTLYSSYLKQTHDVCARNHKVVLEKHQEQIFVKRYEEFEDEEIVLDDKVKTKFFMIKPKKSDDIKHEGDNLNHCVASYIKRVLDGTCRIFFLRKKEDESLITIEVRDGRVLQVRGSHNRSPYPDEINAIKIWANKHEFEY